jgi:hypothetical protein
VILYQYHENHQYPIRGHDKGCHAEPLNCSPQHFHSADYKLRLLMVHHSENPWAFYVLPFVDIRGDLQESNYHFHDGFIVYLTMLSQLQGIDSRMRRRL